MANNGFGPIVRSEIILTVKYPPEIISDEGSMTHGHIVSGKKTSLTCVGRGVPRPDFSWKLPNQRIITDDNRWNDHFTTMVRIGKTMTRNTLHIEKVNSRDAGKYICMAKNNMGTANRSLIVLEQTPSTTRPLPNSYYTAKQSSRNHSCSVVSIRTIPQLLLFASIVVLSFL